MKLGSLFDGSGTAPLAASMCGIEPVWASEIEPYPIAVTKARFPNMKHLGSILDIKGGEIEPVDIICGGSPCQDLSVAGAQKGLIEGERSNLFFEMIRIIKEMRNATNGKSPRWVIWENVPGAFSSNKGKDFLEVLRQYSALADPNVYVPEPQGKNGKLAWRYAGNIVGHGWSLAWRTVDAQYWGVPQRRRRIYLVIDLGSERAGEILFERNGLCGDSAQGSETGEGTPADAEGSSGGSCIAFKERAGKPGGGKGILPSDGRTTFTLATSADQSVCYEQKTEQLYEPKSLMDENWEEKDTAGSLRANASKSGHVVVETSADRCLNPWDCQSKRILPTNGVSDALCAAEKRPAGLPPNVCYKVEAFGHDERSTQFAKDGCCDSLVASDYKQPISVAYQTVAIEGNGTRESHQGDGYVESDKMYTLNTIERHAVCYGIEGNTVDRNSQKNGSGISQDVCPTLNTQDHHAVAYGVDAYNQQLLEDKSIPIRSAASDIDHVGGVLVLNDQGGQVMDVSDKAGTLRAQEHGHQPIVCHSASDAQAQSHAELGMKNQNYVCYGIDQQGGKGNAAYQKDVSPTLCSDSHGTPHAVCFVPKSNKQAVACDMYNGAITGDITPNLNAKSCNSATHSGPSVLVINDRNTELKATEKHQISLFDDLFKED